MTDTPFTASLLKSADEVEAPLRRALRRLLRRKGAIFGLAIIVLFLAIAIFGAAAHTLRPDRAKLDGGA